MTDSTQDVRALGELSTHRVLPVGGPALSFVCIGCRREIHSAGWAAGQGLRAYQDVTHGDDVKRAYADLDGKPWVDYYCAVCAVAKGAKL